MATATTAKVKKQPRSKYNMLNSETVMELRIVRQYWRELVMVYRRSFGDAGTCVLGAGFTFSYKGEWYFMREPGCSQGSLTWEQFKGTVESALKSVEGVDNVSYEWGNMD